MLKALVRSSIRQLGYSIARGNPSADLEAARRDLASAHRELASARHELGTAHAQIAEYQNAAARAAAIVREATLFDPTPKLRLKDHPRVHQAVRDQLDQAGLPSPVNQILVDPEFSLQDRQRYMKLFHHVYHEYYDRTAAAIATMVNGLLMRYEQRQADQRLAHERATELRQQGIVRLGQAFSSTQVRNLQDYFLKRPVYNGHVPMSARHRSLLRYVNYTAEQYPLGSYSDQDIALAPHLLEYSLSPLILDTAAAYFGCIPRLTWLQSWWNFAGPGDYPHRQNLFHRDTNDFGMFWLYVYLTDVDEGSGPHRLIRQSGDFAVVRERYARAKADPALAKLMDGVVYTDLSGTGHNISDEVKEKAFEGLIENVSGPAGTAFLTRGVDLHKVITPLARKRQIFAARFCINEFPYLGDDRDGDRIPSEVVAERVGSDEQLRYITSQRFDWSNFSSN